MIVTIYLVFSVAVLFAFKRLGGYRASLLALIGGFTFLPVMDYPGVLETLAGEGWSVRGIALLQPTFVTRATVVGGAILFGLILFDRRALGTVRWRLADLPISTWCLLPLLSGSAAGVPALHSLGNTVYMGLAFGVPYLVGRTFLGSVGRVRGAVIAFIGAAVLYTPLCLYEIVAGPRLYEFVYGWHPHQLEGAVRWLGWRPVVFTEHGNQLGIFMATVALFAFWMHRSGALPGARNLRSRLLGFGLPAVAVLCQALAPAILLVGGMFALTWVRRLSALILILAIVLPVGGYAAFRLTGTIRAEETLLELMGPGAVQAMKGSSRLKSLAWRVSREEEHLERIHERFLLGQGRWDWWDRRYASPWGYWTHAIGSFGLVGLITFFALLIVPVVLFLRRHRPSCWAQPDIAPHALLCCALIFLLLDGMLNTTLNLPFLLAAGALNSPGRSAD